MPTPTLWRLKGEGVVTCSCAWGCPCQFNASPTLGRCTGNGTWRITDGYHGETRLDELCFAILASFPGPLHEGSGTAQWIIDERAGAQQRDIFDNLFSGAAGGTFFEIFSSITSNKHRTIVSPIHLESDQNTRRAIVRIPGCWNAT